MCELNGITFYTNILLQKEISWLKEKTKTPLLNPVLELSLLNNPSSECHVSLIRPQKFTNLVSLERSSNNFSVHVKKSPNLLLIWKLWSFENGQNPLLKYENFPDFPICFQICFSLFFLSANFCLSRIKDVTMVPWEITNPSAKWRNPTSHE